MRILAAQLNYHINDFEKNSQKMLNVLKQYGNEVNLIVFSELCLSGFFPYDLLCQSNFVDNQNKHLQLLQTQTEKYEAAIVVGFIDGQPIQETPYFNGLCVLQNGKRLFTYHKKNLSCHNLFSESHYFKSGKSPGIFSFQNKNVGFLINEDSDPNLRGAQDASAPLRALEKAGCDVIICMASSASHGDKQTIRQERCQEICRKTHAPLLFTNQVGGYDDVVYDGASFVVDAKGDCVGALKNFEEDIGIIDISNQSTSCIRGFLPYQPLSSVDLWYQQCQLGLKDYVEKCHLHKVVIGISGGIDSSLSTALAAKALGAHNVIALFMPSKYSSKGSISDSKMLCKTLGIQYYIVSIDHEFDLNLKRFEQAYQENPKPITEQNMQARIRGNILMEYANQHSCLVLATGNKSEVCVGYATLYGDMSGGYNMIGDIYKTEVYQLAKHYNQLNPDNPIPKNILEKLPSAELAHNQLDTDALPPYPILDPILKLYIEKAFLSEASIEEYEETLKPISTQVINEMHKKVNLAEFKRRQSPLILRMQKSSFSINQKLPIAARY